MGLMRSESASTIFFEWNPLGNVENRKEIFLATVRPTIQYLILR